MKKNVYARRKEAWDEQQRQMLAAGLLSERFPEVSSIVVTMNYRGKVLSTMLRTLNFYPDSHPFFKVSCLGEGCEDGGLDLTRVIHKMIGGHEKAATGKLSCENRGPAIPHADVDYEVTITYAEAATA